MKQLLLLLFMMVLLAGCQRSLRGSDDMTGDERLSVITYEGCEYLCVGVSTEFSLTHKGDCVNPIHLYNPYYDEDILETAVQRAIVAYRDSVLRASR